MTHEQRKETILFDGMEWEILETPLQFCPAGKEVFTSSLSDLYRGYLGSWKIHDNKLYLFNLVLSFSGGLEKHGMEYMFNTSLPVFAIWYTGTLTMHHKNLLFGSKDLCLQIENGILIQ